MAVGGAASLGWSLALCGNSFRVALASRWVTASRVLAAIADVGAASCGRAFGPLWQKFSCCAGEALDGRGPFARRRGRGRREVGWRLRGGWRWWLRWRSGGGAADHARGPCGGGGADQGGGPGGGGADHGGAGGGSGGGGCWSGGGGGGGGSGGRGRWIGGGGAGRGGGSGAPSWKVSRGPCCGSPRVIVRPSWMKTVDIRTPST